MYYLMVFLEIYLIIQSVLNFTRKSVYGFFDWFFLAIAAGLAVALIFTSKKVLSDLKQRRAAYEAEEKARREKRRREYLADYDNDDEEE